MATVDQLPELRASILSTDQHRRRTGGRDLASLYVERYRIIPLLEKIEIPGSLRGYVGEAFAFLGQMTATRKGLEGRSPGDNSGLGSSILVEGYEPGIVGVTLALPPSGVIDNLDKTRRSHGAVNIPLPPVMNTNELMRLKAMYGERLPYFAQIFFLDEIHTDSPQAIALATHPEAVYGKRVAPAEGFIRGFRDMLALARGKKVVSGELVKEDPSSDIRVSLALSLRNRQKELWRQMPVIEGFRVVARVANPKP